MATGHEHTVKAFDQDIGELRGLISQMAAWPNRQSMTR